jgi:hypothetical protein
MDETLFWSILEAGGRKVRTNPERQLAAIRKALLKLSPEEVRDFQRLYNQKLADAYTWDLWAAAYLINGGCSDDGFYYFREWLLAQGQAVFEAAVENPDSLAGLTDPQRDNYEFQEPGYLPLQVYEELTGEPLPPMDFRWPTTPRGRRWDFEDDGQVAQRLPQLARIYLW